MSVSMEQGCSKRKGVPSPDELLAMSAKARQNEGLMIMYDRGNCIGCLCLLSNIGSKAAGKQNLWEKGRREDLAAWPHGL